MATEAAEPEHLMQQALESRAKKTVLEMAKELETWESTDEEMQTIDKENSRVLKPYVEELLYYCKALIDRCKITKPSFNIYRVRDPLFLPATFPTLLIPISIPEGKEITIAKAPFEVGSVTYINEGVRLMAPIVFLLVRESRKEESKSA